jgi:(p)ppGpp synthase/HD superfamily hydrolase
VTAHQGQVYPTPSGEPFILHPLRMMRQVEVDIERIVAVLHDVVEDTAYTLDDLHRLGYPDEAIEALDRLTRREGEPYEAYIGPVAGNRNARRVKLADVAYNLGNHRRLEPTAQNRARVERYERAQACLLAP